MSSSRTFTVSTSDVRETNSVYTGIETAPYERRILSARRTEQTFRGRYRVTATAAEPRDPATARQVTDDFP